LIAGAILENVTVRGLAREGRIPLFLAGVAFDRCRLEGKLSAFKLAAAPSSLSHSKEVAIWNEANRSFYSNVEWAVDIRDAEFSSGPDLHFIPGSLVLRDPESQALVRRDRLNGVRISELNWGKSALGVAISWFLEDGPYEDTVLVAAKRSRNFSEDVAAIQMLRSEGLAEPN